MKTSDALKLALQGVKKYVDNSINTNSIVRPYEIFRVEETIFGKTGYIDVETMEPSVKYGLTEEYLDCNTIAFVIPTATTPYPIVCLAASFQVSDLMVTEKWEGDPSKGEEGLYIIVKGLNEDYKINIRHKESKNGVTIETIRNTRYLHINNTKEFIPTGDYNPATKKYVDDAIPSIEGLATNFELNEMMLHQSVNFSELFEEKILINVNTKGNHTVYAPEDNGDTTKALKRYMNIDQDLSSVNYGDYFMIDYREQNTPMTNLIFYKWGEFADKSRLISHVLEICVNNTRVQILTRLIKDMQSTAEGTLIDAPGKCTLQLTLSKTYNTPEIATIFDAMQVIIRFLKPHFLPLDNKSFEYTPTEDYQPATKKYVDDTIEENGFSGDYNDLDNKPCYIINETVCYEISKEQLDAIDTTGSDELMLDFPIVSYSDEERDNYRIIINNKEYPIEHIRIESSGRWVFEFYNAVDEESNIDGGCSLTNYDREWNDSDALAMIQLLKIDETQPFVFTSGIKLIHRETQFLDLNLLPKDIAIRNGISHVSSTAANKYSAAFGSFTEANAAASMAQGSRTQANAVNSHAEGSFSIADGVGSHAEGEYTVATGENQHVQGKYNIEDTEKKYAHIVGNGNYFERRNAHTLDWSGNAWFQGNVSIDGTPTNDNDLVTKKYVDNVVANATPAIITEEDINAIIADIDN